MSVASDVPWAETASALYPDRDQSGFEPEWSVEGFDPAPADQDVDREDWVDGMVSPFAAEPSEPGQGEHDHDQPTLRRGSSGPAVRRLQSALVAAGHAISVDGDFGAQTEAAVRAFQTAAGLTADGIVGPATWSRLTTRTATAGDIQAVPIPAGEPDMALGTLVLQEPGREYSYPFTSEDLVWTAKLLVHEAGGRDDPDNAAVLWAMFNRYALFTHRAFRTFTDFVRAYSTTLQPVLRNSRAAARHMHKPPTEYIRTGGTYPGTNIPRGQLKRHIDIQKAPWHTIKAPARALATKALTGALPNPGIGLASEFASTRIYFKQHHGRDPSPDEWRRYTTDLAARKRWRWIGDVTGLNQMKNAFFLDERAVGLPADAVRIEPPAQDRVREDDKHGEWEPEDRELHEPELDEPQDESELDGPEDDELEDAPVENETYDAEREPFVDVDELEGLTAVDAEPASLSRYSIEGELETITTFLAQLPSRVLSALRGGHGDAAVRLMVAAGVRDENRLSNMVFHARHPELGGRSIQPHERALAAEWLAIRNNIVRPLLHSAVGAAPAPGIGEGGPMATSGPGCRAYRPTVPGALVIASREFQPPTGLMVTNWAAAKVRQFTNPRRATCRRPQAVQAFVFHETQGTIPWRPGRRDYLNNTRGLSVQMYADVDGRIFQHNDLVEVAWHGAPFNQVSVGIEIVAPILPTINVRSQAAKLTLPLSQQLGLEPYRTITTTWMQRRREKNPNREYVLPPIDQVEGVAQLVQFLTDPSGRHGLAIPRQWIGDPGDGTFILRGGSRLARPTPGLIAHAQFKNTKDDGLFAALYCWLRLAARSGAGMQPGDAYTAAERLLSAGTAGTGEDKINIRPYL
jgi:hypothetical protein